MSLIEMKKKGYIPQKMYVKLMVGGTLSLGKTILFNMSALRKLRRLSPTEKRYARPVKPYTLPQFKEGMQYCNSEDKYLRETLFCDPKAPEVIALANQLGAFKKPDYEFAEAAFEFVKRNLPLEITTMDSVEATLKRGTGTCFHLISAFIALCRSAGIKARYKVFAMNMIQQWYDTTVAPDPIVKKWYDSMGYFMIEGEGEAYIDGKWIVAHVGPTPERQAAAGLPITVFGEDSLGEWFFALPETIMRMESIPFGFGGATRIIKRIAPGSVERINASIHQQIAAGKKIIEKAGGEKEYDKSVRKKKMKMPSIDLTTKKGLNIKK